MKVSTINLFAWVGSLAITGTLGAYVYDSYGELQEPAPYAAKEDEVGRKRAADALGAARKIRPAKEWRIGYEDKVVPNYVGHDWVGKPEVKQPDQPVITTPVEKPRVEVADLLFPSYFQVDTTDPGGSMVLVQYLGELATYGTAELRVADTLPEPHAGITVVAINTDSIEFSFAEEGRENETYNPNYLGEDFIYIVKEGEEVREQRLEKIIGEAGEIPDTRPKTTSSPAPNVFLVGTDDAAYLNQNYETILSQEVRTRTRRGPNGERAGIEVMEVAQGSFAQRHGVPRGDVVISINGHPVNSRQEAIQWAKDNGENIQVFEVVVERLGRLQTLTYRKPDRQ